MGRMRGRKKEERRKEKTGCKEEARGNRMEAGLAPVPCLQYLPGKQSASGQLHCLRSSAVCLQSDHSSCCSEA